MRQYKEPKTLDERYDDYIFLMSRFVAKNLAQDIISMNKDFFHEHDLWMMIYNYVKDRMKVNFTDTFIDHIFNYMTGKNTKLGIRQYFKFTKNNLEDWF